MPRTSRARKPNNMFSNAPVITNKPAQNDEAPPAQIEGVRELAAVRVLNKAVKEAETRQTTVVSEKMIDEFIARRKGAVRPANFKAQEEEAEASCQLQTRSEAKGLEEDELKLLKHHKIPFKTITVQEPVYVIDPEMAKDQALLEKVHEALKDIVPEGFIKQMFETRHVVTENTINAVFALEDPKTVRTLLHVVTTPHVRTNYEASFQKAWDIAKDLIPQPVDPNAPREPWSKALEAKAQETETPAPQTPNTPAKRRAAIKRVK